MVFLNPVGRRSCGALISRLASAVKRAAARGRNIASLVAAKKESPMDSKRSRTSHSNLCSALNPWESSGGGAISERLVSCMGASPWLSHPGEIFPYFFARRAPQNCTSERGRADRGCVQRPTAARLQDHHAAAGRGRHSRGPVPRPVLRSNFRNDRLAAPRRGALRTAGLRPAATPHRLRPEMFSGKQSGQGRGEGVPRSLPHSS
jgi:hypothetical protein